VQYRAFVEFVVRVVIIRMIGHGTPRQQAGKRDRRRPQAVAAIRFVWLAMVLIMAAGWLQGPARPRNGIYRSA
jgi:hypothetical protein